MRIGLLSGSLGSGSSNAAALAVVGRFISREGVEPVVVAGLEHVPPFVSEQVDHPADSVSSFRSQLDGLDALVIAAPEYAAGLAGATKNALDWLVGASTLYRKLIAVMSVGTTGGEYAIEQLVRTLSWQGAFVVATLGVPSPKTKMTDGEFSEAKTIDEIHGLASTLIDTYHGSAADRLGALSAVVTRYGIDASRFGTID